MSDELETRLAAELRAVALPAAPAALRDRVRSLPAERPWAGRSNLGVWRGRPTILIAAATGLVLVAALGAIVLSGSASNPPVVGSPSPSAGPSVQPPASLRAAASLPTTVDGITVISVAEAIAERDGGSLGANPVAIRGFWSDATIGHSCNPPDTPTGDLEIYCRDGEYGITELDEPIEVISEFGYVTPGTGPALTPWLANDLSGAQRLFSLPIVNGQRFPPVPIVVVGHFDDPRAADCRPKARDLCRKRLVVDRIVVFDPDSVPPPAPTPTPTPFPVEDPPPAPYDADACAEGHPIGFRGWTTLRSLGLDLAFPDKIAYIVITKDPIPIGDWFDDPNDGTRYRLWGQRVCYGYLEDQGAVGYTAMPGTEFREYPDGRHEPTVGP